MPAEGRECTGSAKLLLAIVILSKRLGENPLVPTGPVPRPWQPASFLYQSDPPTEERRPGVAAAPAAIKSNWAGWGSQCPGQNIFNIILKCIWNKTLWKSI